MTLEFIDSHTGGEPTRTILGGWPLAPGATPAQVRQKLLSDHADLRAGAVCEPRGSDVLVGAVLMPPVDPENAFGVVFFNNAGPLMMCGHGTIGVVETLRKAGRLQPGRHRIETPVGIVTADLEPGCGVTIRNVASRRDQADVVVNVPGFGNVTGDIAYGGNWFFLTGSGGPPVEYAGRDQLLGFTCAILDALDAQQIRASDGSRIDHIEVFGQPAVAGANSKNFVLCPGRAYDRSACGTGTSAKVACLAATGALRPGERWIQESITGSCFEAWYEVENNEVIPHIKGEAFVTASGTLHFDERDPFCWGIG